MLQKDLKKPVDVYPSIIAKCIKAELLKTKNPYHIPARDCRLLRESTTSAILERYNRELCALASAVFKENQGSFSRSDDLCELEVQKHVGEF